MPEPEDDEKNMFIPKTGWINIPKKWRNFLGLLPGTPIKLTINRQEKSVTIQRIK